MLILFSLDSSDEAKALLFAIHITPIQGRASFQGSFKNFLLPWIPVISNPGPPDEVVVNLTYGMVLEGAKRHDAILTRMTVDPTVSFHTAINVHQSHLSFQNSHNKKIPHIILPWLITYFYGDRKSLGFKLRRSILQFPHLYARFTDASHVRHSEDAELDSALLPFIHFFPICAYFFAITVVRAKIILF